MNIYLQMTHFLWNMNEVLWNMSKCAPFRDQVEQKQECIHSSDFKSKHHSLTLSVIAIFPQESHFFGEITIWYWMQLEPYFEGIFPNPYKMNMNCKSLDNNPAWEIGREKGVWSEQGGFSENLVLFTFVKIFHSSFMNC